MEISRHAFIFGLSYALDILGRNNLSHSKSTAYLSVLLARDLRLPVDEIQNIYYGALLHDIGVTDEYIVAQVGIEDMQAHCSKGREMLEKLSLPEEIPLYTLYHHEYYDGSGTFGLKGEEIPRGALIICLASDFDDNFCDTKEYNKDMTDSARRWIESMKGKFPDEYINSFIKLMDREFFLLDYFNHETKYTLSDNAIGSADEYYTDEDIIKFAICFAEIIDQRSPYTFFHSAGIAALALRAARKLGYDEDMQTKMYLAGLLHDIGKLYISADILHKEGPLSPEERFEINKHTYYTRKILGQIQGLEGVVDLAANHHEKPDGMGYPYHLKEEQISEPERVMAICDVYQALTEERPYRGKLPSEKVWGIIDDMAGKDQLDKALVEKLKVVF